MINKLRDIVYLMLLSVFLLPSIVKIEHHHDSFMCKAKSDKHFHVYHGLCTVCNFEFSVFSASSDIVVESKAEVADKYNFSYKSTHSFSFADYSFLLRAPPL
ncbi:MAG: hypothetical protein GXO88_01500 [Chlorobi bacterium]|nr:hypothetical protein [Chlorobiota bacterium]